MTRVISGRQVRSNMSWLGSTHAPWVGMPRHRLTNLGLPLVRNSRASSIVGGA